MSFQMPKTVKEVVTNIHTKKYLLPAIRREVVWRVDQITRLFDSLMRDYPIGTFLFWHVSKENVHKYQFYEFLREYHEKDCRHNPKADVSGENDITGGIILRLFPKGTYTLTCYHPRRMKMKPICFMILHF